MSRDSRRRDRRQVVELRQDLALGQSLDDAEREGRAADPAAREAERRPRHVTAMHGAVEGLEQRVVAPRRSIWMLTLDVGSPLREQRREAPLDRLELLGQDLDQGERSVDTGPQDLDQTGLDCLTVWRRVGVEAARDGVARGRAAWMAVASMAASSRWVDGRCHQSTNRAIDQSPLSSASSASTTVQFSRARSQTPSG